MQLNRTAYFYDFVHYYQKAEYLQSKNLYKRETGIDLAPVGDDLMDQVPIYDTVNRRYAGFSKVLEDLHGRRPDRHKPENRVVPLSDWLYIHMIHRATGSGASFCKDHGYRNTCIFDLWKLNTREDMIQWFLDWDKNPGRKPIFTSVGNQPPAFNKVEGYNKACIDYFVRILPFLCDWAANSLQEASCLWSIRLLTDMALEFNRANGLRQYNFVYTAWAMDVAEYFPELVDPRSHANYGKNCMEALDLMYEKRSGYDHKMADIMEYVGNEYFPMDYEDVCCDYIRYIENYIPNSKDYDHLDKNAVWNRSSIANHSKGRQKNVV